MCCVTKDCRTTLLDWHPMSACGIRTSASWLQSIVIITMGQQKNNQTMTASLKERSNESDRNDETFNAQSRAFLVIGGCTNISYDDSRSFSRTLCCQRRITVGIEGKLPSKAAFTVSFLTFVKIIARSQSSNVFSESEWYIKDDDYVKKLWHWVHFCINNSLVKSLGLHRDSLYWGIRIRRVDM